jgi:hypothetical protein
MSYLISQIIPSLQVIKILSKTSDFLKWIRKKYPDVEPVELFEGYKFSISCCLNTFVDGIANDCELKIDNDFLLNSAISQIKRIHLLEPTCDKTVFLKNIKTTIKSIAQAKSLDQISEALIEFNSIITSKFDLIFDEFISLSLEIDISKEKALNLLLIDFTNTYLVQINNNGPTANIHNPLSTEWINIELTKKALNGYKFSIQFLWNQLVGDKKFNSTHLSKIHLADSWNTYKYTDPINKSNSINLDDNNFNLDEQTNFDCHYYWIEKEIIKPLSNKNKVFVTEIDSYFGFSDLNYNRDSLFGALLDKSKLKPMEINWEERIEQCLYWYPFEIVNSNEAMMFFGVSSFNTMLAGTVALHKHKDSELPKIIVARFTHPSARVGENDYSYGILIDSKSAAGHHINGWIIFQNVCSNYSGFSNTHYKSAEKLIRDYMRTDKLDLRELTIPLAQFQAFTKKSTLKYGEPNLLKQAKLSETIIQTSRSYLFELFTYYLCKRYYIGYEVELNSGKKSKEGEKDIIIQNNEQIILIECKLNAVNSNPDEIVEKMERKIRAYSKPIKSCQLWVWKKLSPKTQLAIENARIEGRPIKIITLDIPGGEEILRGVDLSQFKTIMQEVK